MIDFSVPVVLPADAASPNLTAALRGEVPNLVLAAWRELASDFSDTGGYMRGLTPQDALLYPFMGDPNAVAVVNTARHAAVVEEGHAGFHLAARWGSGGGKWKQGKNGPYAHVPFQHFSPTSKGGGSSRGRNAAKMPAEIYRQAVGLGRRDRLTGFGDLYKRSQVYTLMAHQGMAVPSYLLDAGHYTWQASKFEGLFKSVMQSTERRPRHSKYMTIRTIKPGSLGWFIPAVAGRHLAQRTFEEVRQPVQEALEAAAAADFELAVAAITEGL